MTDPFESIYGIVYQLTMRTVACNEIANDRDLLDSTLDMFEKIEAASSPKLIIFPWFPFPGKLRRLWYGGKLYMVFKKIIDDRAKTGRREDDPLQFLIEKGDSVKEILTFILGESNRKSEDTRTSAGVWSTFLHGLCFNGTQSRTAIRRVQPTHLAAPWFPH